MATQPADRGDIIQITKGDHPWFPCLLVVTEARGFGCQAYAMIPHNDGSPTGNAYLRITAEDYVIVGSAVVMAA